MLFQVLTAALLLACAANAEVVANGSAAYINDNNVLQFALTLEYLEYNFYQQGVNTFNASQFNAAQINTTLFNSMTLYQLLTLIRDHEKSHVSILNATLIARGATPVLPCTYNFNYTTVNGFLQIAAILENTGVSAYDGAINALTDTTLKGYAATIATVEARHAAFLNLVTGYEVPPFQSQDTPVNASTILAAASQFITSCPQQLTLPVLADSFRNQSYVAYANTNNNSAAYQNDNQVLQFALTYEILAATYYNQSLTALSKNAFANAGVNDTYYQFISLIGAYEAEHVAFLQMTLTQRGATPVSACTYNFNYSSVAVFLNTQAALQNTDVSAYTGAAGAITDAALLQAAADIATAEARYASFANFLINQTPFPNVQDVPLSPPQIVNATSFLFNVCPTAPLSIANSIVPADNFRPVLNTTAAATTGAAASTTAAGGSGASTTAAGATTAASGSATTGASGTGATASATTGASGSVNSDSGDSTTVAVSLFAVALALFA